jgi:hypothetical protein
MIEPEIMFGFAAAPSPGMDDAALLSCVAWVAHGFEIVQSIFPDWKFSAADTVVANAMHGALLLGPRHDIGSRAGEWLDTLANFDIELYCDGQLMDRGHPSNILGGPLSAVRHLVELRQRPLPDAEKFGGEVSFEPPSRFTSFDHHAGRNHASATAAINEFPTGRNVRRRGSAGAAAPPRHHRSPRRWKG